MKILGLSAFYHDSAAALLIDGTIAAAAQQERFTRKKHDSGFPREAAEFCLRHARLSIDELDYIVFYEKPFLKFERLLETYLALAPRGLRSFRMAMPVWIREKLFQKSLLIRELKSLGASDPVPKLLFTEHHHSHAASAFYASPFEEAAVLTMDGVGEWTTTSVWLGRQNHLEMIREIRFPHSLGLLYSAFTYYTGFRVNSGEYKLMGLAPYGRPVFSAIILEHLIDVKPDGSFHLNMDYFDYATGLTMITTQFADLFGGPARKPNEPLTQRHMDVAASIQTVLDQAVLKLTRSIAQETGMKNLCLAGGVALNCVSNGKILRDGRFEKLWIQPAAGDAGGALGAALAVHHDFLNRPRTAAGDTMQGAYLGPGYSQEQIEAELRARGGVHTVLTETEMLDACVADLIDGRAVGWFQGRMEFGPRALGARSILADARSPAMQSALNLKVKYRESFRPFAPAVLAEDAAAWFDLAGDSPYMLLVGEVLARHRRELTGTEEALTGIERLNAVRSSIPAVTHVDYSARIQTVHRETNRLFHDLISIFKAKTGCPVIVNTSFNVRGEPIVGTPSDAFRCFMGTGIETLAIGNCYLRKRDQDPALALDYSTSVTPD